MLARSPLAVGLLFNVFRLGFKLAPGFAAGAVTWLAGAADKAVMRDKHIRLSLAGTFQEGFARGVRGPMRDLTMFREPWPFDPSHIVAKTGIWMGDQDRNVPLGPIRALVRAIRGCEMFVREGQGHFWIARDASEVLKWLARRE